MALGRGDLEQTQRVDGEQGEEAQVGSGGIRGRWVCLGEEGTHRSSLGELQPPAPQPTGPVDPISHPTPVLTASSLK